MGISAAAGTGSARLGAIGAVLGATTPWGLAFIGASVAIAGISGWLNAKQSYAQTESAIDTEKERKRLAEDNSRLAYLEGLSQASQARKRHVFQASQMKIRMSSMGFDPMIQELWMGQTLAEMEGERATILKSGEQKSKRFTEESEWLKGNIGKLQKAQEWSTWGHFLETTGDIVGILNQQSQWKQQQSRYGNKTSL
ncbi:hypothetical protein [Candidatus Liberibacter americanus]|uniref:Uncharacterized protein n=1 Tax=Candidatus Liberibacter americanus str. Sao Paulo TaxID=1261131 RepID=U6B8I0_9HYPH|nr:hypothetical protein [Candidatus Liberibacter americanus]AHA28042.1 hypothetical protein lam_696 [Candidatus Liberibacter americanus str. Sao Paulo]EMS35817.1 hypothetical protein G653_04711 [Candidatus Liberibacter americanus PW_SP]